MDHYSHYSFLKSAAFVHNGTDWTNLRSKELECNHLMKRIANVWSCACDHILLPVTITYVVIVYEID